LNGDALKFVDRYCIMRRTEKADRLIFATMIVANMVSFKTVPNRVGDSPDGSKKFERATQHHHPRFGGDGDGLRVLYQCCGRVFGSDRRIEHVG